MLQPSQQARWEWAGGHGEKRKDRNYRIWRAELAHCVAVLNADGTPPDKIVEIQQRTATLTAAIDDYERRLDVVVEARNNEILQQELRAREDRLRAAEHAFRVALSEYRQLREEISLSA